MFCSVDVFFSSSLLSPLPSGSVLNILCALFFCGRDHFIYIKDTQPYTLAGTPDYESPVYRKPLLGCPTDTLYWTSKPNTSFYPQICSPIFPVSLGNTTGYLVTQAGTSQWWGRGGSYCKETKVAARRQIRKIFPSSRQEVLVA